MAIPVYNEGENIAPTLRGIVERVRTAPREILVIYDFDEDTTVPVARRLQSEIPELRLVRNQYGRGALGAIRTGFASSRGRFVVVMMADGSDEPQLIDRMVAAAEAGADVVAASRYMRGGRQIGGPPLKGVLSRTAGLSLHWLSGIPIHDPTNNFKLYSRRLLDAVSIESTRGFEVALELCVKAHALGMRVAEVPTIWRDRTAGQSNFKLGAQIPHYLRWYRVGLASRLR